MVVISKALNDKLYQGANSVGRDLRMEGQSYRIVGVMKEWSPEPHFYDLTTGSYGKNEDLLLPISTSFDLKLGSNGNMNCFGENPDGNSYSLNAPCAWLQYWVEMDPAKAADYRRYLENYSSQQRQAGRFKHPPNVRLRTVMEWLDFNGAVPSDVRLQLWLALGFLGVCPSTRWACCWPSSCAAVERSACAAHSVPAVARSSCSAWWKPARSAWSGACWASAWPCSACSRCASNRWSTQSWPTWTATCCCSRWA